MSTAAFDDLQLYAIPPTDDPLIRARRRKVAEWALEVSPETRQEIQCQAARGSLRRVLKVREIALGPDDETRIDACADLATLERWLAQAVVAATASEALR